MTGLLLIGLGVLAGALGWLLLRRSGSGWRVGRLLAAAPRRSLAEAAALAAAGTEVYVRLHGRIDSDEEFPDGDGRPLVFRRRRLQRHAGRSGWVTFDDERLAVPFRLSEKGERIEIDTDALGDGLVVIPRESVGVAGDIGAEDVGDELPELPADALVRLRVEQVSAIDHATAAGVPRIGAGGSVVLGPGLGRPLVLTTLETDEAMRVLAGEGRGRLLLASGLLAAAAVLIALGLIVTLALGFGVAVAADPSALPSPSPTAADGLVAGGDPRSEGEGPGLVGQPLMILFGVIGLGLATTVVTALIARALQRP